METQYICDDTIEAIRKFMPQLADASLEVSKLLFEPLDEQGWLQFADVVEGIDDLYRTLSEMQERHKESNNFDPLKDCIAQSLQSIAKHFGSMNQYMDIDDHGSAGDIIRYELIPVFRRLALALGDSNDVNRQRFQTNMKFLEKKYPNIYNQIKEETKGTVYQLSYANNGSPIAYLLNEQAEPVYLNSQFNPENEAAYWADTLREHVDKKSKIIFYGLGLGYEVERYAQIYPNHVLFIYEPDINALLMMMGCVNLQRLFSRLSVIHFIVGHSKSAVDELMDSFHRFSYGEAEIVALPFYLKSRKVEIDQFAGKVRSSITKDANFIYNYKLNGFNWAKNIMYNFSNIIATPSIAGLKNRLSGMTAVIVGAGPSLESDIEQLRQLKKHAIIIAAGTTTQSLLHYGIEPHLIVSIDGSEANYRAFQHLDIRHIPFVFSPMLNYSIADDRGELSAHLFLKSDITANHFMSLTNDDPIFSTTHSVTGTAIQTAIYMGCEEIVFAGQDLSYYNYKLYAQGAKHVTEEQVKAEVDSANLLVENVKGTVNRTHSGLRQTLEDIENLISTYTSTRFINTTAMGAVIKHTVWESMESVVLRLQNREVSSHVLINEMKALKRHEEKRITALNNELIELPEQMRNCQRGLKKVKDQINSLSRLSKTNEQECMKVIHSIDQDWEVITNSSPFKGLFLKANRGEMKIFEASLSRLILSTTLQQQVDFYLDCMMPLIAAMLNLSNDLSNVIAESRARMDKTLQKLNPQN
ncbi:motility associated factor glycosyltransferase family protein [Paenibacillus radicis (ex Gao et al. 2016)]|uniref:6-hydroxymethylpterin diphosphokinase MptE-like domain-containing protein n=1 Tax=Paenibacillus radicis (ex Gao et al. 2016) TaxID=1737354 RepID=A0A917M7Q9_9BACL|nr:6-hydroxymethylpterin diphosphokinase MptE-like protein [Paenibacillus radicis (ex Gao et al. 2016)]GGG84507.1 hypothetical protein GCM10010918_47940 [Paenibacillus radicis (ex Gao et al. 2016)]